MSAVSPITTPVPWSMNSPLPMRAAGWISIPVSMRVTIEISRGKSATPAAIQRVRDAVGEHGLDAGQVARISSWPTSRAAGSRVRAACTSRRTSLTTRASSKPAMPKA